MRALLPLPAWTSLVGFVLGAVIGSFLNVVIYRMPRAIPLGKPSRSFCPKCRHSLGVPDLFPLLSWLFAGRRCRYCHQPVASRYFWVELFNALIWAGIWYEVLVVAAPGDPVLALGKAAAYSLAASALVAIIFVDIELYLIPDQINAFILFVGIAFNMLLYAQGSPAATTWGIPSSLAGWSTGVGVLWGIALLGRIAFRKDAMGHGDIKMARGIGALLFPAMAAISFGLAVFLGAVIGIAQVAFRKRAPGLEEEGEDPGPESIGSLLKCGVGYILCLDVVGLFWPKFYRAYFNEDPFEPPEDLETFEADRTMIPFGPYLALGAILAVIFERQLMGAVESYLRMFDPASPAPALFWNIF